jgi:hypothetical protein
VTRRRKRLAALIAGFALVVALALPGVRWRLLGWIRGEPFWRGMPASYYAARIRAAQKEYDGTAIAPRDSGQAEKWVRQKLSTGVADAVWGGPAPFLLDHERPDAAAVPVLAILMTQPEPRVRKFAAESAAVLRHQAAPLLPELVTLLDDPDRGVREMAALALGHLGPAARPAIPRLTQMAGSSNSTAANAIRRIDPSAAKTETRLP